MFTVVADALDSTARLVASVLASWHGPASVRWLPLDCLTGSALWSHRVERHGAVTTRITLPDGRVVDGNDLGVVFNRAGPGSGNGFLGRDREYATMERFALLLSWLGSLPGPVVNPPSPRGLGGATRGLLEWLVLASKAGLPVRPARVTTSARRYALAGAFPDGAPDPVPRGERPALLTEQPIVGRRRVLVAGELVAGAPDDSWGPGLRTLGRLAGCPLLAVAAGALPGGRWIFETANPWPEAVTWQEGELIARALTRLAEGAKPA